MNKVSFALTVIITWFVSLTNSCASFDVAIVDNTAVAGVVVQITSATYTTNYGVRGDDIFSVYIDDKKIGNIKFPEIKGYKLKNGIHTIYFTVQREDGGIRDRNSAIRFTIDNDRHYFDVGRTITEDKKISPIAVERVMTIPVTASVRPGGASVKPINDRLINTAINNSFSTVFPDIPINSKIALINIASSDKDVSSFILEELTVLFVNSKQFTIVDRQTLDAIRRDHNFQISGEVNDETIISIGNFAGADVVITGTVSGDGRMRRLRLYVLDVKTAQVLAASSERI
jgi:hypothetical protein